MFPIYKFLKENLDFCSIDHAFVFNGRFLLGKILSIFCHQHHVPYSCYEGSFEWGPTATRFNLVEHGSLQNFRARSATLYGYSSSNRSQSSHDSAVLTGCRSLKDRVLRKKQSAGYRLFIDSQFISKNVGSNYVLFLTTSLFEFFLTDDFLDGAGSDQLSMLRSVILCLPPSKKLVIREHPNSLGADFQLSRECVILYPLFLLARDISLYLPTSRLIPIGLCVRLLSLLAHQVWLWLRLFFFLSLCIFYHQQFTLLICHKDTATGVIPND